MGRHLREKTHTVSYLYGIWATQEEKHGLRTCMEFGLHRRAETWTPNVKYNHFMRQLVSRAALRDRMPCFLEKSEAFCVEKRSLSGTSRHR